METENRCSICLYNLFLQPLNKDLDEIKMWCGPKTGFSKEFRNNILEKTHIEICRTKCFHSFHKKCLFDYTC